MPSRFLETALWQWIRIQNSEFCNVAVGLGAGSDLTTLLSGLAELQTVLRVVTVTLLSLCVIIEQLGITGSHRSAVRC